MLGIFSAPVQTRAIGKVRFQKDDRLRFRRQHNRIRAIRTAFATSITSARVGIGLVITHHLRCGDDCAV